MKTYLALNRLTFYFERTDKAFKALFGILYLTNDINSAQQFYANHYLSEALKIDEMPSYEDLLIMLFKVGSHAVKINSDFNGKLSLQNLTQEKNHPIFDKKLQFKINVNDYPDLALGLKIILDVIKETQKIYTENQKKNEKFNLLDVDKKIINEINNNGYSIVENFFSNKILKKLESVVGTIAKKERDTQNAYIYGKDGKNQRIYNLLSKHQIFRDILDSYWIEKLLDTIFDRKPFHEKYGLSSFAAHIVPPGGEEMPLHLDNAVPDPIPSWVMRFIIVIPLTDFTENNGSTVVVPKSHKLFRKPTEKDENCDELLLKAKSGSLILWDGNLWHKSTKNNSNSDRNALIISYAASFFKEICGEEEHLVVVPKKIKDKLSSRIKSLIGMNRGLKKGATFTPDYD